MSNQERRGPLGGGGGWLGLVPRPAWAYVVIGRMGDSSIFTQCLEVFRDNHWTYSRIEGAEVLRAGFRAMNGTVDLHLQAFAEIGAVSVVAESPRATTEPARRERLAELVLRTNEQLTVGNFEMVWDTGRVLFRVTNLFEGDQLAGDIVAGLVRSVIAEMDRMAPLLVEVHETELPALGSLDLAALLREQAEAAASDERAL